MGGDLEHCSHALAVTEIYLRAVRVFCEQASPAGGAGGWFAFQKKGSFNIANGEWVAIANVLHLYDVLVRVDPLSDQIDRETLLAILVGHDTLPPEDRWLDTYSILVHRV